MDLHAWITQQVDAVERADPPHRQDCESVPQVTSCCGAEDYCECFDTFPCDCDLPAAIRRRCEADRRILARHKVAANLADSPAFATACDGCRSEWLQDDPFPFVDNINDCPELLDLAHAHGITDEILAGLDRPEAPEPRPRTGGRLGLADILATPPITTSDVPEALRGPRWKP